MYEAPPFSHPFDRGGLPGPDLSGSSDPDATRSLKDRARYLLLGDQSGVLQSRDDRLAIGVDRDQAYIAPKNVLTSSLKNVDIAVDLVSRQHILGRQIGGKTLSFGLTEDAVGIPEHHENYSDEIYNAAIEIGEMIKERKIKPPINKEEFKVFLESLKEGGK